MSEWQTIDTAPKDNTVLLLCAKIDGEYWIDVGYWETYNFWHGPLEDDPKWEWPFETEPTHWMHLPEPPK